jgi:hypothetical protein
MDERVLLFVRARVSTFVFAFLVLSLVVPAKAISSDVGKRDLDATGDVIQRGPTDAHIEGL